MSSKTERDEEKLARYILGYFLRNPQSADSLEGVARWRLLDETIHHALTETRGALERLVAEGYLLQVSVPGSDRIYVLNAEKRGEAEKFMGEGNALAPKKQ